MVVVGRRLSFPLEMEFGATSLIYAIGSESVTMLVKTPGHRLITRSLDLFPRIGPEDALLQDAKQVVAEMTRQQVTGA